MVGWFDGFLSEHRFRDDLGGFFLGSSLERVDDIFVHHQILEKPVAVLINIQKEVNLGFTDKFTSRMQRRSRESWKKMNWNCQQTLPPRQSWRNLGSELVTWGALCIPTEAPQ